MSSFENLITRRNELINKNLAKITEVEEQKKALEAEIISLENAFINAEPSEDTEALELQIVEKKERLNLYIKKLNILRKYDIYRDTELMDLAASFVLEEFENEIATLSETALKIAENEVVTKLNEAAEAWKKVIKNHQQIRLLKDEFFYAVKFFEPDTVVINGYLAKDFAEDNGTIRGCLRKYITPMQEFKRELVIPKLEGPEDIFERINKKQF